MFRRRPSTANVVSRGRLYPERAREMYSHAYTGKRGGEEADDKMRYIGIRNCGKEKQKRGREKET